MRSFLVAGALLVSSTLKAEDIATDEASKDRLAPGVARIHSKQFSKNARLIDFDHAPDGSRIVAGDNITEKYQPLGVHFGTGSGASKVAADEYVVDSMSRGLSAAGDKPRWTDDLWIKFDTPTGPLRTVGFFIAHVYPNGSGLRAYANNADGSRRLLAEIYTTRTGTDFLGIASETPIEFVHIFRVESIDPNFTIDDLRYEPVKARRLDVAR